MKKPSITRVAIIALSLGIFGLLFFVAVQVRQAMVPLKSRAEAGDPEAQLEIGTMYEDGQGVNRDYAEAQFWLTVCDLETGAHGKCKHLTQVEGAQLSNDEGVAIGKRAYSWLQKRAEQGNANAQLALGEMIEWNLARRDASNYPEALKWYLEAAEQGNATAQMRAGIVYDQGRRAFENTDYPKHYDYFVPRDPVKAAKWLRKAGDQGDILAQFVLGRLYEHGDGVKKDLVQAYVWYGRAAKVRKDGTDNEVNILRDAPIKMDQLAKEMTPTQLAEAKNLSAPTFWNQLIQWMSPHL